MIEILCWLCGIAAIIIWVLNERQLHLEYKRECEKFDREIAKLRKQMEDLK